MNAAGEIRELRERLLAARRGNDADAIPALVDGLQSLAGRGYRCCVVDFDACRPQYYVRVVGFEDCRVTAELEFPIEPRLRPLQRVPLSHLVEYDELEPSRIRTIYESMAPFLHHRRLSLTHEPTAVRTVNQNRTAASPSRPRHTDASAVWWGIAGLLLVSSLVMFAVA